MTSSRILRGAHRAPQRDSERSPIRRSLAFPAAFSVIGLAAALAIAPPASVMADLPADETSTAQPAQSLRIEKDVAAPVIARDSYTATTGAQTLIAGGTNYDWARLVMTVAGWPTSEGNITVFTRWMRQENGADNWWNRNNPLNNGWGSGGGSGLGSYDSLVTAAENAADALQTHSGYAAIAAGFAASAPTEQIEAAIWASPWASSHYANGSHWHYTPVDVVEAPADAWR